MATRKPLVRLETGQTSELPSNDTLPLASFGAVLAAIGALALAPDSALIVDDAGAPSLATASADGQVLKRAGGALTFAALVAADIPALDAAKISSGTLAAARLPSDVWRDGGLVAAATDWNTLTGNRTRRINQVDWTGASNHPASAYTFGTLASFGSGTGVAQLYFAHNGDAAFPGRRPYYRVNHDTANWSAWTGLWTDGYVAQNSGTWARSALGLTGWATAAYTDGSTSDVAEGSRLYYTDARVRAAALTGFSASNAAIVATDSILAAFGKAQGQIAARESFLGNPAISGYLLSSSSAGTRSWVAPYAHPATHPWSVVDPRYNAVADFDRTDTGFWIARSGSTVLNRPDNWTSVVHFGNDGGTALQLAASYDTGVGRFYLRKRNDTSGTWSSWYTVWHTGNLGFGAGTSDMARGDHLHDGRYLKLAGGSLSGPLSLPLASSMAALIAASPTQNGSAGGFILRSGATNTTDTALCFGSLRRYETAGGADWGTSGTGRQNEWAILDWSDPAQRYASRRAGSNGDTLLYRAGLLNASGDGPLPYASWGAEIASNAAGNEKGLFRVDTADGLDGTLTFAAYLFGEHYLSWIYTGTRNGLQLGATRDTGFNLYQDAINGQTTCFLGYGGVAALSVDSSSQANVNFPAGTAPTNSATPAGWILTRVAGAARRVPYYT